MKFCGLVSKLPLALLGVMTRQCQGGAPDSLPRADKPAVLAALAYKDAAVAFT